MSELKIGANQATPEQCKDCMLPKRIQSLTQEVERLKEENEILSKSKETGYDPFEAGKRVGAKQSEADNTKLRELVKKIPCSCTSQSILYGEGKTCFRCLALQTKEQLTLC